MLYPLLQKAGALILLDHLYFQIIKRDAFRKVVLGKAGFAVQLKIADGGIQPDGMSQIEFRAYFINGMEYLVSAGITAGILHNHIV